MKISSNKTKPTTKRVAEAKNVSDKIVKKPGRKADDYEYTLQRNLNHDNVNFNKGFKFKADHKFFRVLQAFSN